jgi:hypothetical protein
MTRSTLAALGFALVLTAQAPPPASAPTSTGGTPACTPRTAPLGPIGRAAVVAFTGPQFGDRVCALVVNLAVDGYRAALAGDAGDAPIAVALTPGSGASLTLSPDGSVRVASGAPAAGDVALAVGPFVVAPGGEFTAAPGADDEAPRVVLAYAGQRIVLLATSPVTLIDLTRALRDQPDLFGIDAPERAVVLASGAGATLVVHTSDVTLGTPPTTAHVLRIAPRT